MVLNKTVGLTGASGLLGRHIIAVLLKKKYKIIATSRKKPLLKNKNLEWKKLDLNNNLDSNILDKLFYSISILIHAGATVPIPGKKIIKKYNDKVNILATTKLAKWSKNKKKHFVYISGSVVYEKHKIPNKENSKILKNSKNSYINSKIIFEKKLLSLKRKGLKLTILRPSSLYGWGLGPKKIICKFISKVKNKKNITIENVKKSKINLIHAYDVANFIYLIIKKNITGIFNIGNQTTNLYEVAKKVKLLLKSKIKIFLISTKNISAKTNQLSVITSKATKKTKWRPVISLHKGIKCTIGKKCY